MAGSLTGTLCHTLPEVEIYAVAIDVWLDFAQDHHGLQNVRLADAPETSPKAKRNLPPSGITA